MRCAGVRTFGKGAAVEIMDASDPTPGVGEVLVRVQFAGVNPIDITMRNGGFSNTARGENPQPLVLGLEGAGVVERVGEGVTSTKAGDRVAYCIVPGSFAELAIVPAWRLAKVPDAIPLDIACAMQLQGNAAHYLATSTFPIANGDICLIHAGAGGVSQYLIQIAKLTGARVIATASTPAKAEVARARGADDVILYSQENFTNRVMALTQDMGAHVVYDGVGRETITGSIRATRRRGLCVNYGTVSGVVDQVVPASLGEAGSIFFTRPHLSDHLQDATEVTWRNAGLFDLYTSGKLTVAIDSLMPLAKAGEALNALEARSAKGKVLLQVA